MTQSDTAALFSARLQRPETTGSEGSWALDEEPEPEVPADVITALHACPEALATWQQTTPLARLDWVHWIVSAKQTKTRAKRIGDACEMLAEGHKRVCCFDTSGFYSKAFSAPRAVG